MRWTFFVLVGCNILLLGWNLLVKVPGPESVVETSERTSHGADVPGLVLLAERPSESVDTRAPSESTRPTPTEAPSGAEPDKAVCTLVGPFKNEVQAEELSERLAAMEVPSTVTEVAIPDGPGYWVYLEPLPSRREALRRLSELQAQGVDSYVIPKGDLANGISLGMFSRKGLADARVEEMTALGLDVKVEVIERSHGEIWVSIRQGAAAALGESVWQRLLGSDSNIERRQNFCPDVASQDNFH